MELKKVRSAGDPIVVKKNQQRIDPLLPSLLAVFMQLVATLYLYSISSPTRSVIGSGVLTLVYATVTYLLNKKPRKKKAV